MTTSKLIEVDAAIRKVLDRVYGITVVSATPDLGRAAIEAMRRPSNKMLKAAAKAMSPGKRPTQEWVSGSAKHGIRYRAMIDEVLAEPIWSEHVAAPKEAEQHDA